MRIHPHHIKHLPEAAKTPMSGMWVSKFPGYFSTSGQYSFGKNHVLPFTLVGPGTTAADGIESILSPRSLLVPLQAPEALREDSFQLYRRYLMFWSRVA